jgi:hypothetical protein
VVFSEKVQVMVPESVPLSGAIDSQAPPEVTAAVQGMVPEPALDTPKVVVPAPFETFWLVGVTERSGMPACVTVTSTGLPDAPVAVT